MPSDDPRGAVDGRGILSVDPGVSSMRREETGRAVPAPVVVGASLALASAVLFGSTTPFVQKFGREVGTFATGGLLYVGSALAALFEIGRRSAEPPLRAVHARRVVVVSGLGAVVAPVCLAWGLQRAQGTTASLMLNSEALFTVLLARFLYRELIGPRTGVAMGLMLIAGALLVQSSGGVTGTSALGTLAIAAAALAWAADNSLTRPLADLNTAHVILVKSSLGAALSLAIATASREAMPGALDAAGLVACGALGYGLSLRCYLGAQRRMGAARTGSVFALAPFVGAVVAWGMGDHGLTASSWIAGALFALGVFLHLTDRHVLQAALSPQRPSELSSSP